MILCVIALISITFYMVVLCMRYAWSDLYSSLKECKRCGLHAGRSNVVIGDGNPRAPIMFIGEGPGRDEDLQGIPFVGAAGKLLDKMLEAIGLSRDNAYISNIVKCRPPSNRNPNDDEAAACLPYLRAQVALVKPKVIVCLGAVASKYIYDPKIRITRDRGEWKQSKGVYIIPTYHPAALLRDPAKKRASWEDFQSVRAKLEELELLPVDKP